MKTTAESSALHSEIVGMLYANNRRSLMAAFVVMVALLLVQRHLIAHAILGVWSTFFVMAYSTRAYLGFKYHQDLYRARHSRLWLQWFRASTALCSIAWGMAGILLFPETDTAHQAFLIHGSSVSLALAVLFIVYVVYVTVAGRSLANSLRENISLRIASNLDNKKVYQLAYYDFLTGLPNRRLLTDRLNQAFARCARSQHYGAVLCLDLNNFKGLNDSKGHQAGDELLQQVANRLQQCLRKKDTIARMGGDEFIAVLDELSQDETEAITAAQRTAQKMMAAFSQPFELQNSKYRTTPSIGICLFFGEQITEEEVLRRADIAMYQAKKSDNLNSIQMYDEVVHPAVEMRATLENELAFALSANQLLLYFQMQVDNAQQTTGAEVLLRWQHPTLGMIPPDQFIPLAEENGEIVPIGQWVLVQACQQLAKWAQSPQMASLTLSVNMSAIQFSQPDFVHTVTEAVLASGCNPSLLRLELTESLIVKNMDDVIGKMHALKALGITFSLDDFGIGQSSLSVLNRLPLDELKIDRSFIKDIAHDSYDAFIVQTIINLGKNLGHHVIAEGVEVQEQMTLLQQMGCNHFQGFLFSRPLPLQAFEDSLQAATIRERWPERMSGKLLGRRFN